MLLLTYTQWQQFCQGRGVALFPWRGKEGERRGEGVAARERKKGRGRRRSEEEERGRKVLPPPCFPTFPSSLLLLSSFPLLSPHTFNFPPLSQSIEVTEQWCSLQHSRAHTGHSLVRTSLGQGPAEPQVHTQCSRPAVGQFHAIISRRSHGKWRNHSRTPTQSLDLCGQTPPTCRTTPMPVNYFHSDEHFSRFVFLKL